MFNTRKENFTRRKEKFTDNEHLLFTKISAAAYETPFHFLKISPFFDSNTNASDFNTNIRKILKEQPIEKNGNPKNKKKTNIVGLLKILILKYMVFISQILTI